MWEIQNWRMIRLLYPIRLKILIFIKKNLPIGTLNTLGYRKPEKQLRVFGWGSTFRPTKVRLKKQ